MNRMLGFASCACAALSVVSAESVLAEAIAANNRRASLRLGVMTALAHSVNQDGQMAGGPAGPSFMATAQSLPLRRRIEPDLLDRAGERERALRLVVRADSRDGISPDFERFDPLAYHCRAD